MTYSLLSKTTPRATRTHRCIWCGEDISPRELYVREKSAYDGRMQNFAWHRECERDSADYFQHEEEFSPHEHSRPDYRLVDPTPILKGEGE